MFYSDLVKHRKRMKQLICFDGLTFGSITPMDIDLCIEYHDKAVIFCEYKLRGCKMPRGQRLCLERLANNCDTAGKLSVVMLCEHEVQDTDEDVKAEEAEVKAVYYKGRWYIGDGDNVKGYLMRVIRKANNDLGYKTPALQQAV